MNKMLLMLALAIFFFVDQLVFFRVFLRNGALSVVVVLLLLFLTFFKAFNIIKYKVLQEAYRTDFFLVLLYISFSSAVHMFAGQEFTYLISHEIILLQCGLLFALLIQPKYRELLIGAYFIASFLHLLTIIPGFSFLTSSLADQTAYGEGAYDVGIVSRRATGFFNSPGQLSIFAAGGISLGLADLQVGKNKRGTLLTLNSLALGITSLSRSFFVVCLIVFIIYLFKSSLSTKLKFFGMLALILGYLFTNETFLSYLEFLNGRFDLLFSPDKNDRLTGETGLIEVLKVVQRYPIFGNGVAVDGKAFEAWNGEITVRPHVGLLCIMCFYGLAFGWPVFALFGKSVLVYTNEMLGRHRPKLKGLKATVANPFVLGYVAVNVTCLVEPLLESSVYFFFLFGMLHAYSSRKMALIMPEYQKAIVV